MTSAEAPSRLSSLTSTEAFAASSCSALPRWPLSAAYMQRSPTSAPRASEAPRRGGSPAALSSRAASRPGRPRPRPSPGERRRPPCRRSLLPSAARPSGRPLPQSLEESVEAAPVAAQVAPHRRQVARLRAASAMSWISARGEMQQK